MNEHTADDWVTAPDEPGYDEERVQERAQLLPEEETAGSTDPEEQAQAILQESEERSAQAETDARTHNEPIERHGHDTPL